MAGWHYIVSVVVVCAQIPAIFSQTCEFGSGVLNGVCQKCGPGTYYVDNRNNGGLQECVNCPYATYQDVSQQTSCKNCPTGTNTSFTGASSILQCAAACSSGFFLTTSGNCQACPIGTYQPSSLQSSCISCQSGTITLQTGSTSSLQCVAICSSGFFRTTSGSCQACPVGTYQPSTEQTSCISCPTGTSTNQVASTSQTQCIAICSSGFFRTTSGSCQACPVGTYQPSTEQTSCISCPTGTSTNQVASTSQTQCIVLCSAGFFLNTFGNCQACSIGTYQPSSGQSSCISCQSGTITLQTGSTSSLQCVAVCSSGFIRTTSGSCQACPVGTYQPSTEQPSCISCPTGTSTNQVASTSQTQCVAVCSAGFFLNTLGNCQACSIGTYQPSSGQSSCISCQSGTITLQAGSTSSTQCVAICSSGFFRSTSGNCQACPFGTYQPSTEQSFCISCPSGTTTNQVASTSQTQCVAVCSAGFFLHALGFCQACALGTYQSSSGQSSCISCQTGTTTLQTGSTSSAQCVAICSSGFFRTTSGSCQACPFGTYQPSTEQSSCISCPTGTSTNQVASTSQAQCVAVCSVGFFLNTLGNCQTCPVGTYQPSSGQTSCISCQSGTITLQTGSSSSTQCVAICNSGFFRTTSGNCQACPVGTYQPSTEQTSCISCPTGTSTNQVASTSQTQCVGVCSAGFFLHALGFCQACALGTYQPSSGQSSCISCQTGTITLQTGSTSSTQCVALCSSGFFRTTSGSCQACPFGTYQPSTEQSSCISCPTGTSTNQVASTSQAQCVAICSVGFFINTQGNCQACPIGTYQPSSGQSSCITCQTGTITLQTGSTSSTQCVAICNSGFFRTTSGNCQACPVGTYQPSTEQSSCISCPTGTSTNQVASTSQTQCIAVCSAGFFLHALGFCQACALGTYQPSSGQSSCISCQTGTITLQTGSTSSTQCVAICSSGFFRTTSGSCQACPFGTYQPSTEQSSCISCPTGTSTNQVASTSQSQCVAICSVGFFINTQGNCQACPIGTYQPSSGQSSCISCQTGTITLQTGSTSSSQCVAICNSGFFRTTSGNCQACPVGTYQPSTEQSSCISCPTGTSTNQVASTSQTQCIAVCSAGFFLHALGFCQACALGTYQPSSGQSSCISCQTGTITLQTGSTSSTQCVAICSSGFFRTTSGSCQACPFGTYQPSTEQSSCISCPTGTSTNQVASTSQSQCVAICSVGFFINTQGNCQACPIGTYQPSSGQSSCISCQTGTITLQTGSTSSSQCVAICNSGFFRTTSGNCQACPVGTYQPSTEQSSCISCPTGTSTNQVASTSQTQCIAVCSAGFFLHALGFCQACALGTYQPSSGQSSCISCQTGTITLQTGSTSSTQCVAICSSGFFRTTSGSCQACPFGTYQPSTEQSSCISCPTGTSTNQVASTSQSQCVAICSVGFFINTQGNCQACPIGTYQPSSGQSSCISCQTGTITLQTGSTSSSQCVAICNSGFFRTTSGNCQACPVGTYQPSTEQSSCISCPTGTSTNQVASTSQTQCVAVCSAGFFLHALGFCQACALGTYQPSSGQSSCISCQTGTITLQTGSTSSTQCVAICSSGFFRTTSGSCQACPFGTYQPSTEQSSCISCPTGTSTNQVASTSQSQCVAICSVGFFINTQGNCQACPIGTYQPSSGQSSCISCQTGTITLQTGSTSSSQCVAICNSGFFRTTSGNCQACPVGTYQPSTEQSSCISCPTGTSTNQVASTSQTQCVAICSSGFFRTTSGSCQACPFGTYQPSTEQSSCISCPTGTSTNQVASTSQSQCVAICSVGFFINTQGNCQACPIGTYQPSSGQSSCISCQTNTITLQTGSISSSQCVAICNSGFFRTTSGNCQACPVGTYQPSTEQSSCISCPTGTSTNQVASTSQTQCVAVCSAGFFLHALGFCQACALGTYQPSSGQSSCISCQTGTITLQTGSTSFTQCVDRKSICSSGFFRSTSGSCQACPFGTYQPSTEQSSCISCPTGTSTNQVASTSQSQCVAICSVGFFINTQGNCQACPIGTYQPSSGQSSCISCQTGTITLQTGSTSSSQCVAICNSGFFRTTSGNCQACPVGTYQPSTEQSSCISCPTGTSTNQVASTSQTQCVAVCSAGFFLHALGFCQACALGTYQPSSGQSSCISCQTGTITLQTGSTSSIQCVAICSSGFFRTTSGSCQACPFGTYQSSTEQSSCISCPTGTSTNQVASTSQSQCVAICSVGFYLNTQGNCQTCPIGTYQPSSGQSSCISCQTGTITLQTGSTSSSQCVALCNSGFFRTTSGNCQACPVGTYQTSTEQSSCISCPNGTSTNQVASTSQTQCVAICSGGFFINTFGNCQACPIGTYQPFSGQFSCISCQSGTITLQTGSTSSIQCVAICSSGFFRATSASCQACPFGTYQPNTEQSSCLSCPTGTSTNQVASTSQTQCVAVCSTGFFLNTLGNCQTCPVGTYQPSSGQSSCIPCQTGTLTLQTGSTSSSQCVAVCSPGFFRAMDGMCQACPGATYQPNTEQSSCISCPNGTSTNQVASTSQTQCIAICSAGFFINTQGNCQSCPLGTYQPSSGQSTCISCQTGTLTLQTGSTSSVQCVAICSSGFFRTTSGSCQACPIGTYQPNTEQFSCFSCPTGTSTTQVASASQTQCVSTGCTAGSYLPPGGSTCQTCPSGTFQPIANATSCILCSIGTYSALQGQISCTQCSAGSYQANPGSTFCLPCAVGQYQNSSGQTFCMPCPVGTYKSQTGQGTCTSCPSGQTTNAIGSTSSSDCFQVAVCNAGTYLDVTNNICRQCEFGFYQDQSSALSCKLCGSGRITLIRGAPSDLYCLVPCLPGKYHSGNVNTASCMDCPLGQYQPTSGQQSCLNCASSKTTYLAGSTVCYDICNAGSFFSTTILSCQLCPAGQYQPFTARTECFNCPQGYVSTTGATQCQVFCSAGQRIDSLTNQCIPCEIGTYQPATSQTSCISCGSPENWITNRTGSTSISDCRYFCPSGYYKVGVNSCEPCPVGTYKDNAIDRFGTCQQCPSQTTTNGTRTTSLAFCNVYLCPPGTYWSFIQTSCQACQIGSYQPISGTTSCINCQSPRTTRTTGTTSVNQCVLICQRGYSYNSTADRCDPCSVGFYQDLTDQTFCKACSFAYTTANQASVSINDCIETCSSGLQYTSIRQCDPCSRGTYRTSGIGTIACQNCPNGFTTFGTGASSISECNIAACSPGTYRTVSNICEPCPIGAYQPDFYQDSCRSCGLAMNWLTDQVGSVRQDQCRFFCQSGYVITSNNTCDTCPVGYYKDNRINRFSPCVQCPNNTLTSSRGSTSINDCILAQCPAGYERDNTLSGCQACAVGFYQPSVNQNDCIPCPPNYSTSSLASDSSTDCERYCPSGQDLHNNTCVNCPRGYFKDNTMSLFMTCTRCPVNYVTSTTGTTSIIDCSVRDCPSGTKRNQNDTGCIDCEVGSYQPNPYQRSCIQCATGYSTRTTQSTSISQCERYCPPGTELINSTNQCNSCPVGFYSDSGFYAVCMKCPIGFITINTGSTSVSDCNIVACDAGSYRDVTTSTCRLCAIGEYQDRKYQTSCKSCGILVPTLLWRTTQTGSTSSYDCIYYCPSGYELRQDGKCYICPTGLYKDNNINILSMCTVCPDGKVTPGEGAISQSQCTIRDCPAGFFANVNVDRCTPCGFGTYQPVRNQTNCINCLTGASTKQTGSTSLSECLPYCQSGYERLPNNASGCQACLRGYYKDNNLGIYSICTQCPANFTTNRTAAVSSAECNIRLCPIGSYINQINQCTLCPKGTYQDQMFQTSCISCGPGETTDSAGSDNDLDCYQVLCPPGQHYLNGVCQPCEIGYYKVGTNANRCQPCSPGIITLSRGSASPTDCSIPACSVGQYLLTSASILECRPCPIGTYQDVVWQRECKPCQIGYTTLNTRAMNVDACIAECLDGKERSNVTGLCFSCPIGTYRKVGLNPKCVPCSNGLLTPTTGSITDADCLLSPCRKGYRYLIHRQECEICPRGMYQPEDGKFTCNDCPADRYYTASEGAIDVTECRSPCLAGQGFNRNTQQCFDCPVGSYQSISSSFTCIECPSGRKYTASTASTRESDCLNYCGSSLRNGCSVNATCTDDGSVSDGYTCVCNTFYTDTGVPKNLKPGRVCIHQCDAGYCMNNAECSMTDSRPVCSCGDRYRGDRCQQRLEAESLQDDKSKWIIPLVVVVAIVILIVVAIIVWCCCRERCNPVEKPIRTSQYLESQPIVQESYGYVAPAPKMLYAVPTMPALSYEPAGNVIFRDSTLRTGPELVYDNPAFHRLSRRSGPVIYQLD